MAPRDVFVPATANLHIFPVCNYACRFCYDQFAGYSPKDILSLGQLDEIFALLAQDGVRKLTLAGGEPTLHPQLREVMVRIVQAGLVPAIVTNGRRIDADWLERHGPLLRWLALSCDSVDDGVSNALGRRLRSTPGGHVDHVREVFRLVHVWNSIRPVGRRLRLKLNMVVTALNACEDPSGFIRDCRPERVKVMQMLPVRGENDNATDLLCPDTEFADYVARLGSLASDGVEITPEGNTFMSGSYLMIDPRGCLFQLRDGGYVRSRPLLEVGLLRALEEIGGVDAERFRNRGGEYDAGEVPAGNLPYLIAIEGLDGTGKSTVARALAERLGTQVVLNPPRGWCDQRSQADQSGELARRAFYLRANVAALVEADALRARGHAVVMDRSFASTLVYGEASAGRIAEPSGWPADLAKPDLLVVLEVPEDIRLRRLGTRTRLTVEERALATDEAFRLRVASGYRAVGVRLVDATCSVDAIVNQIVGLVRDGVS